MAVCMWGGNSFRCGSRSLRIWELIHSTWLVTGLKDRSAPAHVR